MDSLEGVSVFCADADAGITIAKFETYIDEHNQKHLHPSGDVRPPYSIRALKGNPRDPLHPETVLEIVGASVDTESSHLVSFTGEKESTDSSYIVLVKEVAVDGSTQLKAFPVRDTFVFSKSVKLYNKSAEDQVELFEKLQQIRDKPTAASLIREKLSTGEDKGDTSASTNSGAGFRGGGGGRRSERMVEAVRQGAFEPSRDGDFEESYRDAFGRRTNDGGDEGAEDVVDQIDGFLNRIDGDVEGEVEVNLEDAAREFDVLGAEAVGDEVAIDLDNEFGDDAGDAGGVIDGENDALREGINADDVLEGGAAYDEGFGGDDSMVDAEADDAAEIQKGLIDKLTANDPKSAAAEAGTKRPRDKAGDAAEYAPPPQRKPKLAEKYQDETTVLKERVLRLLRSNGGVITMDIINREFGSEVRAQNQEFLTQITIVLKQVATKVKDSAGKTEFRLKRVAVA